MTDPDAPDVHLLADLDAGLLDPARAREVRRAALADPRSAAVLDALAATRADLAAVPAPVVPPDLVAGWTAALGTAEAGPLRQADPAGDSAPVTRAPGTRAHDDSAPGSTPDGSTPARPPDSTAPDSTAPADTPGGSAPDSTAPDSTAPADTPGGSAPDSTAPDSTAPADTPGGSAPGIGQGLGAGSAPAGPAAQDPAARTTDAPDPHLAGTGPKPGRATTARPVRPERGHRTRPGTRGPPGSRGPHPTIPRRRWWVLLAAAAALVVGVLALRPTGPPDLTRVELAGFARSTVGTTDLGVLADPARRDGCLAAAGHPGAAVLGGRQVRLDGTPGVLLVLSTGELGTFRVLVVTPGCAVLADDVVGR